MCSEFSQEIKKLRELCRIRSEIGESLKKKKQTTYTKPWVTDCLDRNYKINVEVWVKVNTLGFIYDGFTI